MRVVLDSNVLLRASIHPDGSARRLLRELVRASCRIIASEYLTGELKRVLNYARIQKILRKTATTPEQAHAAVLIYLDMVDVAPLPIGVFCRDTKDYDVVRLVKQSRPDVLCTLDLDLRTPEIIEYFAAHGTRVLTDVELLNELFSPPRSPPMGRIVIAAYRPKPGQTEELHALVRLHLPILCKLGLATDRAPIAMKAADGTVIEVFEWVSEEATQKAHTDPTVLEMWGRFGAVCDMVKPTDVAEFHQMFAHYDPLD